MTTIAPYQPTSDPFSCQYPAFGTGTTNVCLPEESSSYSYADTVSSAVEGVVQSVSNVTKKSALSYFKSFYPPLPDADTVDFSYPRSGTMPVLFDQRITQRVLTSSATTPFMEEVANTTAMCPGPREPFPFQYPHFATTSYEPVSEENGLTISEVISHLDSEYVRKYLPIWITSGAAAYKCVSIWKGLL